MHIAARHFCDGNLRASADAFLPHRAHQLLNAYKTDFLFALRDVSPETYTDAARQDFSLYLLLYVDIFDKIRIII